MNLTAIQARRILGRHATGMAAMLLPFETDGAIAEDAFAGLLLETHACGLTPAVNMDTGYVNLLTADEKLRVLQITQQTLRGAPFVAGAYIEREEGSVIDLYRREIAAIRGFGGTPILFQTARLHGAPSSEVIDTYRQAVAGMGSAYAFELGRMFAPNGEIWSGEVAAGIMEIPEIIGMKHSSLDRAVEMERLALRDRVRPEFRILTGNDLGIDMIEYGSDYLLGLAAFAPERFAARDRLWEAGDRAYCTLADALQYLGNVAFRAPVPAYKHSAAVFLNLLGRIPSDRTHPASPQRPTWEQAMLRDCAVRLELL